MGVGMNYELISYDGIDHINIYSKGKTKLGRLLSNFASTPVDTVDGTFNSIEGYWYWLGCGARELRQLTGWEAKKFGRLMNAADYNDDPQFKLKIAVALLTKLIQNKELFEMFKGNELPFKHYYVYGDKVVIEPKEGKWILEVWELANSLCR